MRNEKHHAIAAAVKAAVASGQVVVLATADKKTLSSAEPVRTLLRSKLASFECGSCKTEMTASADLQPYCVTCGSAEVAKTDKPFKLSASARSEDGKVGVQCASCDTVMVLDSKVVQASAGHLHCTCCGAGLKVQAAADESSEEAPVEMVSDETTDAPDVAEEPLEEITAGDEWPFHEEETASEESAEEILDLVEAAGEDERVEVEAAGEEILDLVEAAGEDERVEVEAAGEDERVEVQSSKLREKVRARLKSRRARPVAASADDLEEISAADEAADEPPMPVVDADDDLEISLPEDDDDTIDLEGELTDMEDFTPGAESDLEISAGEAPLDSQPIDLAEEADEVTIEEPEQVEAADANISETPLKMVECADGDTLMDTLEIDDTPAALALTVSAGRVVAMKGHVAVASLTARDAGQNADIMQSAVFQAAVQRQVEKVGVRAGLKAFGFKPIRVPSMSKATIARKVNEVQQASVNRERQREKVFAASFALAAAGLSRGRWKGYENSLRAAVEQQLQMAGVRNVKTVSARIFEEHAIPFSRSLLELASKLSAMSEESRKEMAETLDMTVDCSTDMESVEQGVSPELETVDARLMATAAVLRPLATGRQIQASVDASQAASAILEGRAPLSFSNS